MPRTDLREILTFMVVGGVSTLIYGLLAYWLIAFVSLSPVLANHISLLVSGVWSYFAQRGLTFRFGGPGHRVSGTRFAVQMSAVYVVSNALYLAAEKLNLPMAGVVLIVVCLVPVCNYFVMKFWVFRPTP